MALFRRRRGTGEGSDAPGDPITVYDVHGRPLRVDRETWRREILPGTLRAAWDDPDRLYDAIVEGALRDELFDDVEAASKRLLEIDPDLGRGHAVRGIVLQRTGRLGEAERVLRQALSHERSGAVLTNLAKVQAERGDEDGAQATLDEAIVADPNQDNGLQWWALRIRERSGAPARDAALRDAAQRPGAWRPQLLLGFDALADDKPAALAWLTEALDRSGDDPQALLEVSGRLGEAGEVADLFALIAPRYTLARHGPIVGLNLLRAYAAVGNHVGGRELLHELMALQRPDLRERLIEFEGVFDDQRDSGSSREMSDDPQVAVLVLDRPPWAAGLHDASWLLPRGTRRGAVVNVVPFAVRSAMGEEARLERSTADGRLARGSAIALAEALLFCTDADVRLLLPEVAGEGALVTSTPWTADELEALTDGDVPDLFVTGVVEAGGLGVVVWQPDTERPLHELRRGSAGGDHGPTLLTLQDELVDVLQGLGAVMARPPSRPYVRPPAALAAGYLEALEQSRAMTVAAQGVVPRERLFGERAMLQGPLELALAWPEVEVPALVFLGNLVKSRPEVAAEFAASAVALIDAARTDSATARLAPLILDVLGQRSQARARAAALAPGEPAAYVDWLKRLP